MVDFIYETNLIITYNGKNIRYDQNFFFNTHLLQIKSSKQYDKCCFFSLLVPAVIEFASKNASDSPRYARKENLIKSHNLNKLYPKLKPINRIIRNIAEIDMHLDYSYKLFSVTWRNTLTFSAKSIRGLRYNGKKGQYQESDFFLIPLVWNYHAVWIQSLNMFLVYLLRHQKINIIFQYL